MKRKFKVGDMVRVKENTHDAAMPDNRMGLVVEEYDRRKPNPLKESYTSIWHVLMSNGKTLKFHEMFLEQVVEEENEEK